jgi:hypothetical protein
MTSPSSSVWWWSAVMRMYCCTCGRSACTSAVHVCVCVSVCGCGCRCRSCWGAPHTHQTRGCGGRVFTRACAALRAAPKTSPCAPLLAAGLRRTAAAPQPLLTQLRCWSCVCVFACVCVCVRVCARVCVCVCVCVLRTRQRPAHDGVRTRQGSGGGVGGGVSFHAPHPGALTSDALWCPACLARTRCCTSTYSTHSPQHTSTSASRTCPGCARCHAARWPSPLLLGLAAPRPPWLQSAQSQTWP